MQAESMSFSVIVAYMYLGTRTVTKAHIPGEALSQTWTQAYTPWDSCWAHPEISTKLLSPARTTADWQHLGCLRNFTAKAKQCQYLSVPVLKPAGRWISVHDQLLVSPPLPSPPLPFPFSFYFSLFYSIPTVKIHDSPPSLPATAAPWRLQPHSHFSHIPCHQELLMCLPVLKQPSEVKPSKFIVITSFHLK